VTRQQLCSPITLTCLAYLIISSTGCSNIIGAGRSQPLAEVETQRSWGRMLDDEGIETKALINIRKADQRLENAHIVVVSFNGNVLLTGQVPSQELAGLAEQTVMKIRYVRQVHNEFSIAPTSNLSARSNDSWITTRIKSKMLFSTRVDPAEVKVVTEAGTVYLLGLVNQNSADKAVEMARNTSGVQKVVRMFEYVK
jgi:osmotically-inducible protein OsmY